MAVTPTPPRRDQLPEDVAVYRRIHPRQFDDGADSSQIPLDTFVDLGGSLSVFVATMISPYDCLQHAIDDARKNRPKSRMASATPLQLVGDGWRIAKIRLNVLESYGLECDAIESNGHVNLLGDITDYALEVNRYARLLTARDCLKLTLSD